MVEAIPVQSCPTDYLDRTIAEMRLTLLAFEQEAKRKKAQCKQLAVMCADFVVLRNAKPSDEKAMHLRGVLRRQAASAVRRLPAGIDPALGHQVDVHSRATAARAMSYYNLRFALNARKLQAIAQAHSGKDVFARALEPIRKPVKDSIGDKMKGGKAVASLVLSKSIAVVCWNC